MNRYGFRGLLSLLSLLPLTRSDFLSSRIAFFTENPGEGLGEFVVSDRSVLSRQRVELVQEVIDQET